MPVTRYVELDTGVVRQINNVTAIDLVTVSVVNGTYRDSPPVVVGGAGGVGAEEYIPSSGTTGSTAIPSFGIAGGMNPQVTTSGLTGFITATGASSVLQDDQYTHTSPRSLTTPTAFWKFTTSDGITTYDCFFLFTAVLGVTNSPPPGFIPTESR